MIYLLCLVYAQLCYFYKRVLDMRSVYIINLKDNRNNGENINSVDKFEICHRKSIIALGWTAEESRKDDLAFYKSYNILKNMKKGDLIWTRNPQTKEYYICEILDDINVSEPLKEKVGKMYNHLDISCYRDVRFEKFGTKDELPINVTYRNLISRGTVRRVKNKNIIRVTNEEFNTLRGSK